MIKDSMILTFSKGIRGILMLIFNMVIARLFSESLYGTYKHINLIVTMLTTICSLGIPTTVSYYYSNYKRDKKNKFIGNTLIILLSIAIVTSILVILFKYEISVFLNNTQILNYIYVISLYVFIMILSSFLENLFISSDNAIILGKLYIIYTIANFILMMITTVILKSLFLLMVGIVFIEFLRTIIMYIYIMMKENIHFDLDLSMLKEQVVFSIPLGVVAIVQSINSYVDNLFISNNFLPSEYAAFANAATDIPLVGIITVSIASVVLPKMSKKFNSEGNSNEIIEIWGQSCKNTALIMFPIFWIALLFSKGYIQIIFSQKYVLTSTPIFVIYLMKFPLYCTVFGNVLIAMGKQKYIMYNSIVGIILNFVLNCIFLELLGMKGPAIATVIVQYVIVILQLRQISKNTNIKITKVMPYKELFIILIIPACISLPIYIISVILRIPQTLGIIIFGILIYSMTFLIYYKLGYIKKNIFKGFK